MTKTAANLGKRHLLGEKSDLMRYKLGIPPYVLAPITFANLTLLPTYSRKNSCISISLTKCCPLKAHI
jgi:hypothetical protein